MVDVTPEEYRVPYIISYIVDPGEGPLLVVDPGPRCCTEMLVEALERLEAAKRGVMVFVTHVHIDHSGAVGSLHRRLGDRLLTVHVHPRGKPHLEDTSKLWRASLDYLGEIARLYGEPLPVPGRVLHATSDGEKHRVGGAVLEVLHTPGHASHHQSLLLHTDGASILFPGDSAGMTCPLADAVAPTTPPPLFLDLYVESLRRQMERKPTLVAYTHTGPAGPETLSRHMEQIPRWLRALKPLAGEDGAPLSKALEAVRREDPETRRCLEAVEPLSRYLAAAVAHSVEGFLWSIRRGRLPQGMEVEGGASP